MDNKVGRTKIYIILLTFICFSAVLFSFFFLRDNKTTAALPTVIEIGEDSPEKEKLFSEISRTPPVSYWLENGMKILLKRNHTDEEDVLIQLMAKGGFASLPKKEMRSAKISSDILWESGFGPYDNTALTAYLYQQSSELSLDEMAFYRVINAGTDEGHLKNILALISEIFTAPRLDDDSLQKAQNEVKRLQLPATVNPERVFDNAVREFNTSNYYAFTSLAPLAKEDLDLNVVKKFIRQIYRDPEDFVCVIVGDFDIILAKKWIEETLGKLENRTQAKKLPAPHFPPFPEGNPQKVVSNKSRSNSVTRITFPVQLRVDEKEIVSLEFLTHLLNYHFREFLLSTTLRTYGITIGYEFPFFPYLDATWVTMQFQTETAHEANQIFNKILREITRISQFGFDQNDIFAARSQTFAKDEYWTTENSYWLNRLTNIAIWNWNLSILEAQVEEVSSKAAKEMFTKFISPHKFSRFSEVND